MTRSHQNELSVATLHFGSIEIPLRPLLALVLAAAACSSNDEPAAQVPTPPSAAAPDPGAANGAAGARAAAPAAPAATGATAATTPSTEGVTPGAVPLTGAAAAGTEAPGTGAPAAVSDAGATSGHGCWSTAADGTVQLDPQGKIVLFDGSSLDGWRSETGGPAQWTVLPDQTLQVAPVEPPTDMQTVATFEDLCLHVEYLTPELAPTVTGQNRGNSGIYFESAYELQVLDSAGQPAGIDTCGAIYGISIPLSVACKPQLVWNTYEIEYRTSQWTGDVKTKPASVVLATLNGITVQKDVPLPPDNTTAGNPDRPGPQPLMLQDHRNLVKFRNIWATIPKP